MCKKKQIPLPQNFQPIFANRTFSSHILSEKIIMTSKIPVIVVQKKRIVLVNFLKKNVHCDFASFKQNFYKNRVKL